MRIVEKLINSRIHACVVRLNMDICHVVEVEYGKYATSSKWEQRGCLFYDSTHTFSIIVLFYFFLQHSQEFSNQSSSHDVIETFFLRKKVNSVCRLP